MTHLTVSEICLLVVLVAATFSACMLPRVFRGVGRTLRKFATVDIRRDDIRSRS